MLVRVTASHPTTAADAGSDAGSHPTDAASYPTTDAASPVLVPHVYRQGFAQHCGVEQSPTELGSEPFLQNGVERAALRRLV